MKIISTQRRTGWITVEIQGFRVEAKVYDEGSEFGVMGGRVSKLTIYKNGKELYNYDRGLEFNNLQAGFIEIVVAELETLPKFGE